MILPLQVESGLDVSSGLLEGLSLGNLGRVVGTDSNDVRAQEDQDISTHLERRQQGERERDHHFRRQGGFNSETLKPFTSRLYFRIKSGKRNTSYAPMLLLSFRDKIIS